MFDKEKKYMSWTIMIEFVTPFFELNGSESTIQNNFAHTTNQNCFELSTHHHYTLLLVFEFTLVYLHVLIVSKVESNLRRQICQK